MRLTMSYGAAVLGITFTVHPVHADIIRVPDDVPTIQQAIDVAHGGDEILVEAGTYFENLYFPPGTPELRVRGESGPEDTVIDGGSTTDRVAFFDHVPGPITLEGFTITHGIAEDFGGGLCAYNSNIAIVNNIITENVQTTYGGAGGGIFFNSSCSPQCLVERNLIFDNIGSNGSGIYTFAPIQIRNNTIVENQSFHVESGGGGIRSWGATIENNIIAFNAADNGAGVYCDVASALRCNDIWSNSSDGVFGSCNADATNISADPQFCSPPAGDYRLAEGSPCLPDNSPPGCGLIGAYGTGCGPVPVVPTSWGRIKAIYR